MPGFVFEAHSTDYQPKTALASLVRDGFAILKVGPGLTFALREALYGLAHIADILTPEAGSERLPGAMERVMQASPDNWRKYYPAAPTNSGSSATIPSATASATTGRIPRLRPRSTD